MNLKRMAVLALVTAARKLGTRFGDNGYASALDDNLLPGITRDLFEPDFRAGAGNELTGDRPKMFAVHSSSVLAVNTFARWRLAPSSLVLHGMVGFESLCFEATFPTGLRGTPPHLDVRLDGSPGRLLVESKLTEFLAPKAASFKAAYGTIKDTRTQSPWYEEYRRLKLQPARYTWLDAAQLVRHYFGLACQPTDRPITLLYLFWEPLDWQLYEPYEHHREELVRFAESVRGDRIRFSFQSYPELWLSWQGLDKPTWLKEHLKNLRNRYEVPLRPQSSQLPDRGD